MGNTYWQNGMCKMIIKSYAYKAWDRIKDTYNSLVHYKTLKKGFRNPMAPRVLRKNDANYHCVKELNFAIGHKDCNNIALTGIYGSGKSSIIKTLLRKHPFTRVLRLSLSRFISNEKGDTKFDEQEVERSIFQHILYKGNPNNTPQSKYRRIAHRSYKQSFCYAVCCLLLLWSGVALWKPEWIASLGIMKLLEGTSVHDYIEKIASWQNIIAVVIIAFVLVFILTYVIRRTSKLGIRSLKYKDFAFDVTEKDIDFSKLLDELLYFLKAGRYKIVVFEDLDRIDNPKELFLKFREINLLLNESEYFRRHHRRIIFIYAIKDDVFQGEERTKFFDYIVPVIPVVDHFNASDFLLKNYKDELNEVDEKDIMTLGLYIGGMRQLLNVMNEYGMYKRMILQKPLSQTKLLAMTIYKNLFPDDYSLAHSKNGCLHDIFEKKEVFSHILTIGHENMLEDLNKQIKEARDEVVKLRGILTEWAHKKGNIKALIIDGNRYQLSEIIGRDDLFYQVETNAVDSYVEEDEGHEYRSPWNFTFKGIVKDVDADVTYYESMEELNNRLFKLVSLKNDIQKKIQTITDYSLQRIIHTVEDSDSTLEVAMKICGDDKDKANVLHSFVRNGYIDDDYKAYLSFTYPGAMTDTDFEFVHSVLQGIPTDYDIKLQSFEQILKSLHTNNFSHKSILNLSLLKYLLKQKDEVRLELFVQTAKNTPTFIVDAFRNAEVDEEFFKRVFGGWNHCIREILKIASETDQKTMLLLFWREIPESLTLDEGEKTYLNDMYGTVCDNLTTITEKAAIKITKEYNLKFEKIRKPDENSTKLYDYVLDNCHFALNSENLSVIFGEEFKTSSYTQVMKGKESVRNYVNGSIADFLRLAPETDVKESNEAIVEILNSKVSDRDLVRQFVGKQESKLENLNDVDLTSYGLLFELDKIMPSWDSVSTYYSKWPDDKEQVVNYIKRHVDELETEKVQEGDIELQKLLLTANETLTIEQYERLAKCFDEYFLMDELGNLEDKRLKVIVDNDLVEYSEESVDFFRKKTEELFAAFIVHFIGDIEGDVNFYEVLSNKLCLLLLNSELPIEHKKWLLNTLIDIYDGDDKQELAKQICFYSNLAGLDQKTDVELVVSAMEIYSEEEGWKVKIDLVNKVNAVYAYNATIEERMLKALGGGYLDLTILGHSPISFDNNEENRTLLNYLKEKGYNVNRVILEEDSIKVTFKRK